MKDPFQVIAENKRLKRQRKWIAGGTLAATFGTMVGLEWSYHPLEKLQKYIQQGLHDIAPDYFDAPSEPPPPPQGHLDLMVDSGGIIKDTDGIPHDFKELHKGDIKPYYSAVKDGIYEFKKDADGNLTLITKDKNDLTKVIDQKAFPAKKALKIMSEAAGAEVNIDAIPEKDAGQEFSGANWPIPHDLENDFNKILGNYGIQTGEYKDAELVLKGENYDWKTNTVTGQIILDGKAPINMSEAATSEVLDLARDANTKDKDGNIPLEMYKTQFQNDYLNWLEIHNARDFEVNKVIYMQVWNRLGDDQKYFPDPAKGDLFDDKDSNGEASDMQFHIPGVSPDVGVKLKLHDGTEQNLTPIPRDVEARFEKYAFQEQAKSIIYEGVGMTPTKILKIDNPQELDNAIDVLVRDGYWNHDINYNGSGNEEFTNLVNKVPEFAEFKDNWNAGKYSHGLLLDTQDNPASPAEPAYGGVFLLYDKDHPDEIIAELALSPSSMETVRGVYQPQGTP
jgi:hypothetical protein